MSSKITGLLLIPFVFASPLRGQTTSTADTVRVREQARIDASVPGTTGWIGRGFLGGLIAGPVGMGYVVSRAGSTAAADATAAAERQNLGPDLQQFYEQAYASKLRSRRAVPAFLGGAVGTGVLVFAIVRIVKLSHNSDVPLGDTGTANIAVPLFQWNH